LDEEPEDAKELLRLVEEFLQFATDRVKRQRIKWIESRIF
jgi:hypothetical protein